LDSRLICLRYGRSGNTFDGSNPDKLLYDRPRIESEERFQNEVGMVPVRLLEDKSSVVRLKSLPNEGGMPPES